MKIGDNALDGCGAVVVSDVPPDAVFVGNPARKIKMTSELKCVLDYFENVYEWEK